MHRFRATDSPPSAPRPPFVVLAIAAALLGSLVPMLSPPVSAHASAATAAPESRSGGTSASAMSGGALPDGDWLWPVADARAVVEPFRAPVHEYGPGHRGMDVVATGEVRAPADGLIAFRGVVVDRPLLTIDHGNGLVTTIEPALSDLAPGTTVRRGEPIATASTGGHTPAGAVHIGVRWNGVYINPMLLFGDVPRAVLLPCGAGGC